MYHSRLERLCESVIDFQGRLPRSLSRFGSVALFLCALAVIGGSLPT